MSSAAKAQIDWERIERDFRAGVKTLRQIGEENGVSHVAVSKKAKREGWDRDLSAKIAAKAEALVTKAEVTNAVTKETKATEREIVESNAQAIANAIMAHRGDIRRNRALANKLLAELEAQTGDPELFERMAELMESPDEKGVDKLNELYRKVISLPSRIDGAKKLAETLRVTIALEREAFGMDKERQVESPLDGMPVDSLRRLKGLLAGE